MRTLWRRTLLLRRLLLRRLLLTRLLLTRLLLRRLLSAAIVLSRRRSPTLIGRWRWVVREVDPNKCSHGLKRRGISGCGAKHDLQETEEHHDGHSRGST